MVYDEDLMRERIHRLIHREDISQREFANRLGRKPSNMSQILNGERGIPKGFVADVTKVFPNVNRDWLLFGEGNMYHDEEVTVELPIGTKPRLPRVLSEGHLADYFEGAKRHLCQEKPIITQFPDYDFSLFLKTDRMAPNYRRGDELFFKKTSIIEPGNCFLLDTAEGPKFKKIYPEEDSIRCVSYNREEYPDFSIPRKLVYAYYKCVGALRIL
jgi:transcriptional regulator with XRE-family HTH domain